MSRAENNNPDDHRRCARARDLLKINPDGPLLVAIGGGIDLAIEAAIAGTGIVHLFEEWLRPHLSEGSLEPVLETWWQRFSGPLLYYSGRRLVPAPLKAFIDFIKGLPLIQKDGTAFAFARTICG